MTSDLHVQAAKVADAANRLIQEVVRLRTDVARLHSRIEPFDEAQRAYPVHEDIGFHNFKEALDGIAEARNSIRTSEYHLAAIRSAIDGIASDAISRAEMKPHIKANK